MAPTGDQFLAVSCTCVGVGPGGTTNLLAFVSFISNRFLVAHVLLQTRRSRRLSRKRRL